MIVTGSKSQTAPILLRVESGRGARDSEPPVGVDHNTVEQTRAEGNNNSMIGTYLRSFFCRCAACTAKTHASAPISSAPKRNKDEGTTGP